MLFCPSAQVGGQVLFPGAGWLELAGGVGATLSDGATTPLLLCGAVFSAPLVLPSVTSPTTLEASADVGRGALEVSSVGGSTKSHKPQMQFKAAFAGAAEELDGK
jgi:hypothetical protein